MAYWFEGGTDCVFVSFDMLLTVSGRSSAYGDRDRESNTFGPRSETSSLGLPSGSLQQEVDGADVDADYDASVRYVYLMQYQSLCC